MAARESAEVRAAIVDIANGMTRAEAAKLHGVAPSTITRAMARREMPTLRSGRRTRAVQPLPEPFHFGDGTPLKP